MSAKLPSPPPAFFGLIAEATSGSPDLCLREIHGLFCPSPTGERTISSFEEQRCDGCDLVAVMPISPDAQKDNANCCHAANLIADRHFAD